MGAIWFISAALLGVAPQVEATSLSGQSLKGELTALTETEAVFQTEDGPKSWPLQDVLEVRWSNTPRQAIAEATIEVRLWEGSRLACQNVRTEKGIAILTHPVLGEFRLPTALLQGIRFAPADAKVDPAWNQFFERQTKSDLLALRKGDVLDHLDGVVGDLTETSLGFLFDGQSVNVKRERVFGVIFAQTAHRKLEAPLRVELSTGERFSVSVVKWNEAGPQLVFAGQPPIAVPVEALRSLDWSQGKIAYLSDLEPRSVQYTPFLDTFVWEYRKDQDFEGRPLRLGGRIYSRGLAIHANAKSELMYRLGGDYRRFQATIGIDNEFRLSNTAAVTIQGDGQTLFQQEVSPNIPPKAVDLDVSGIVELRIIVDYGSDKLDIGDRVHFADAKLLK